MQIFPPEVLKWHMKNKNQIHAANYKFLFAVTAERRFCTEFERVSSIVMSIHEWYKLYDQTGRSFRQQSKQFSHAYSPTSKHVTHNGAQNFVDIFQNFKL